MSRREFLRSVKREIICRAMDATGVPRCEQCFGVAIGGEIHHVDMDAMQIDKSARLTAADGKLLCKVCHKEETAKQAPELAQAKRRELLDMGIRIVPIRQIQSRRFPTSERAAMRRPKHPMRRRVIFKDTGPVHVAETFL